MLTVDEIIETIKRSDLPTVLCEGDDDIYVLQLFEQELGIGTMNFFPCGGRVTLMQVFDRRSELSDKRVAFFADLDSWILSGIPDIYSDIIYTVGYSIENDCVNWGEITKLMTANEINIFNAMINSLRLYLAGEYERHLVNQSCYISSSIHQIIDKSTHDLNSWARNRADAVVVRPLLASALKKHSWQMLRGKTMLEAVVFILSHSKRKSKYSKKNIFDISLSFQRTQLADRIKYEIADALLGRE